MPSSTTARSSIGSTVDRLKDKIAIVTGAGQGIGEAIALAFAAEGEGPHGMARGHHEEPAFLLDARLAGMKAALKLTPDQEKAWGPFEAAVRQADSARREAMREMHERMKGEARPDPVERMQRMSDHLAKASAELKAIADAAKPLYDSLDESQKHRFGPLMHGLAPHHMGGPMGGMGRHHGEMGGMD